MEILQSLFIGIVQGITEFLPVSSSAHLVLIPYIFDWNYNGLKFDIALHFGTMIAILVFFWRDWVKIIQSAVSKRQSSELPKSFLWQIIIASIPAAIAGFFLEDIVEEKLHSPILLAINLAVFGLVLWLVDQRASHANKLPAINYKQSFFVGLFQSLALIPGVSRSGITMVAARGLGLTRESAARLSFLLGTPAMFGAFALQIRKMTLADFDSQFIVGVIASAVAGFLAIKYLLAYLQKSDFKVFAVYRFLLAAGIIILVMAR